MVLMFHFKVTSNPTIFLVNFRMLLLNLLRSCKPSQIWLLETTVMETLLPLCWHIN